MNDSLEKDIAAFDVLLSSCGQAYPIAVVAYVGFKTSQGPRILYGRILLEPNRAIIDNATFMFETEHVVAGRFVCGGASNDIRSFLGLVRNAEIPTHDGKKRLSLQADGSPSSLFSPVHHPFVSEGPRLPSLRINGITRHQLLMSVIDIRTLDWEIKAAESPFDNLDELLNQCGLPTQMQMGDLTTLEIVAKSPTMIVGTSIIENGNAVINCHLAAGLDTTKLRIGYKVFEKNFTRRESVVGSSLTWQQEGDIKVGSFELSVGDAQLLQAFVCYAGISHHQLWVTDPRKRLNPRYAIHQIFDEELEVLKRMLLKPDTGKPYAFENAVSTLFNLLGFSVSNYGRIPKLQKGPNVIAVSPSGNVAIIECTVGILDENDKLAKLVSRQISFSRS